MAGTFKEFVKCGDYVKYIKSKRAMKKLPVYSFDEVDEPDGKIIKKFVRCSGKYLSQMYLDMHASDSRNYVTCVDRPVYEENITQEEFENMKISAILKTPPTDAYNVISAMPEAERATMAELTCSRVANILNVKTEYVAPIVDNPYGCIIVDFLEDKERVESFNEFTKVSPSTYINQNEVSNISSWVSPLVNEVFFRTPRALENPAIVKDTIYPIIEDFAKQYIFKKYIVHDADLCAVNIGIISTPDGKYTMAPAYDFEQCLMPGIRTLQGQGLEKDIDYLARIYPNILKKIAKDFELDAKKKTQIKGVLDKYCTRRDLAQEYYDLIVYSCLNVSTESKMALPLDYEKEM